MLLLIVVIRDHGMAGEKPEDISSKESSGSSTLAFFILNSIRKYNTVIRSLVGFFEQETVDLPFMLLGDGLDGGS